MSTPNPQQTTDNTTTPAPKPPTILFPADFVRKDNDHLVIITRQMVDHMILGGPSRQDFTTMLEQIAELRKLSEESGDNHIPALKETLSAWGYDVQGATKDETEQHYEDLESEITEAETALYGLQEGHVISLQEPPFKNTKTGFEFLHEKNILASSIKWMLTLIAKLYWTKIENLAEVDQDELSLAYRPNRNVIEVIDKADNPNHRHMKDGQRDAIIKRIKNLLGGKGEGGLNININLGDE